MTTNHHTPMAGTDDVSAIAFNSRFSDLDAAITALSSAGNASQIDVTLGQSVAEAQPGYIDLADGQGYLLDADSNSPAADIIRGFWVSTASAGGTGTLQISGVMSSGFSGLTAGEPVFVGTTAGSITQTRPTPSLGGAQVAIMEMGIALSAGSVSIRPRPVQYHKRADLLQNGTLTINHHDDARGYRRNLWAYVTENVPGTQFTGYADTNQDTSVGLRDKTVATYSADRATGGTASASSTTIGSVSQAFDNDDSTVWGGITLPITLTYDLGSGNDKVIKRFTLQDRTSDTGEMPEDFDIQGSNDNITYTTLGSWTGITWSGPSDKQSFDFTNSTSYRYYRLNITAVEDGGSRAQVAEMELLEAATFSDGADKLAQTFTLGSSTAVGSLRMLLRKVGSPTGNITVRVETTSGGNPTGTLADANLTGTITESALSTSYAYETVTFTSATLAAGTYAIVLSTDRAVSETDFVEWGADGSSPSYSNGEGLSETSSTWSAESVDFIFDIYAPGISYPSRISVDWWESTHADVVNRYGDTSGNNVIGETTFKCVRTAGFDDLTVVVEMI